MVTAVVVGHLEEAIERCIMYERFWPKPAVLLAYCEEVRAEAYAPSTHRAPERPPEYIYGIEANVWHNLPEGRQEAEKRDCAADFNLIREKLDAMGKWWKT